LTLQDLVTSAVSTFQYAIVLLIAIAIMAALGSTAYFDSSFAFQQAQAALQFQDYTVLFMVVGFFIISVGLAALSVNNRIFLPISVMMLIVDVLLAAIFADVFSALAANPALSSAANSLPLANLLLGNFPLVIGMMGLIIIVATYTQLGGGGRRAAR
jgi:hypothetical protein